MPTLPLSPDELLTTTRTVRKRLDLTRPVPLELVRECLEVALQAPTGSNSQGWQWLVIVDEAQRRAVGDLYRDITLGYLEAGASTRPRYADPARSATQQRIVSSSEWLAHHMSDVPVLVLACIATGPLTDGSQAGLWGSLLPAAWSYALAARARGLGTAWTTLHLQREAEVAEVLGIPDGYRQGVLLPTAYFTGETFKPAPRDPLDTVLHIDRW